jgi:lipoprotein-anchoring transpeptidase ErfK/SrfK
MLSEKTTSKLRIRLANSFHMRGGIALLLCCALFAATASAQKDAPAPSANDVLAVQIMLDRAGFSPGEIDGRAGRNVTRAVAAFQKAHDLRATGRLDDATRQRLRERAGNQPAFVSYEITDADVAGPFTADIPSDLMAQSKLSSLDYRSTLEALAEKFHSSPLLLRQLNREATFERAGERISVPNVAAVDPLAPPPGAKPAAVIAVTKATSSLTVEDADGGVLFHAPVTTGSRHDPLPIGEWKVTGVQRMPPFQYNPALFWDADAKHAKATIPPGPNNPVGTIWIDLTKAHYGIHGTPEPSRIGHAQSHGCVRLTNWDVLRVAQWARPGTRVVFR